MGAAVAAARETTVPITDAKTDYEIINRQMQQRAEDRVHIADMLRAIGLHHERVIKELTTAKQALDEARVFLDANGIQLDEETDLVEDWRPSW